MLQYNDDGLTISRQCDLLNVPRATYYYKPIPESEYNLKIMHEIDRQYMETPYFGRRKMTEFLKQKGFAINEKRVDRLMKVLNISAMYPKPKIRTTQPGYVKFPYLLRDLEIKMPNQVWGTDITYIPLNGGYLYLVAFLDLYSRFVLSWNLSDSLESTSCIEALKNALGYGLPQIVNSDQGVQYTSHAYVDLVRNQGAQVSMSGKGRCWDNIFVERFWRSLKYEEVYLNQYANFEDAYEGIFNYINVYNNKRIHAALNYKTPFHMYFENKK